MSEEILKALTQLYAIVTKQDGGVTSVERDYVINAFKQKLNIDTVNEYVALFDSFAEYSTTAKKEDDNSKEKPEKLTSVKDSVKTLVICKKINKTLTQKQKIIVITELLEMVKSNHNLTFQRMQIIKTVANTFNIENEEYEDLENFVITSDLKKINDNHTLIINNQFPEGKHNYHCKYLYSEYLNGTIIFHKVTSVDVLFVRTFHDCFDMSMNGILLPSDDTLLFPSGSIVKSTRGSSFYYSDIANHFTSVSKEDSLVFTLADVEYKFSNGTIGLRDVSLSERDGQLIGIMGASGAGKTTLLNVMAGIEKPSSGRVQLNGIDIYQDKDKIQGAFGYVAQDDLLIEELTVFDNLYYNAKLCFGDLTNEEINARVKTVLTNLGLKHIQHLQVGNSLNKKISGGQRKRLNIALELIREPSVLFVDEPTSGLSSRDSEHVIDLLKELSLKGTLIFVVIHQPSSEIYKMFDKMYIFDTGGYQIFNGHPIDAITYFKKIALQSNSEQGQCGTCGDVNVEQLFNIIEEKVVDEYGNFTPNRKITPIQWNTFFQNNFKRKPLEIINTTAPKLVAIPSKIKQFAIYILRDLKSKISNRQYIIINLLEAGVLSLILSVIIRHNNNPDGGDYAFQYNDNIPAYILMSIVVALFIGLSISAEEIIKDKKILKRESILNLSRSSYLFSKITILFSFSAFQAFTFVLIGNGILEIKGMMWQYWLVLWSVSCMANVLGLVISSAFNTAVTVYIMIPLLLIPQMILSGAMFSFDKINTLIGNKQETPLLADVMTSRWAFEALAVAQYTNNPYEKNFYKTEQIVNIADFNITYLLPELKEINNDLLAQSSEPSKHNEQENSDKKITLQNELAKQMFLLPNQKIPLLTNTDKYTYNATTAEAVNATIEKLETIYRKIFNENSAVKDQLFESLNIDNQANQLKDLYFNESLADLVKNTTNKNKFIIANNAIYPKTNAIYFNPTPTSSPLKYRTHFFAPSKQFLGKSYSTFGFNLSVIWLMTVLLYVFLYFDILKKILDFKQSKKTFTNV